MNLRVAIAFGMVLACAPSASGQPQAVAGVVRVHGTVFDSLAGAPLAGTRVEFVRADAPGAGTRAVTTNDAGVFELALPSGDWLAGIQHPRLDSLGLTAPTRRLQLRGDSPVRFDLATPSFHTVARAYCGPQASDSDAVIVGLVVAAGTGAALDSAQVLVQWSEMVIRPGTIARSMPTRTASTDQNGWYVMCGVPPQAEIALWAERATAATGLLVSRSPPRLARMDFAIDLAASPVAFDGDSAAPRATLSAEARRPLPRDGHARFRGVVRNYAGAAVPNARAHIVGRRFAVSGADGVFVLDSLAAGSQTLEVRALGYVPETRTVTIGDSAVPDTIVMTSLKSLLDTVRVTAGRVFRQDRTGFESRRKTGVGSYITRDQFARVQRFTDALKARPGLRVELDKYGGEQVTMPAAFSGGRCAPAIWVDGALQMRMGSELNHLVFPGEVEGVEIYREPALIPAQFVPSGMFTCGAIVIWTRVQAALPKLP